MCIRTGTSVFSVIFIFFGFIPLGMASLPIFPGAEGFGTDTIGGRGGQICTVVNLNDNGHGSFRSCIDQKGPRVIIFNVGGTIKLSSSLIISEPFVSIFGQTSTGDGIMITSDTLVTEAVLRVATHDVLIQHLRLRPGAAEVKSCCRDALSIANPEPGNVFNVVVDHVSMSWGTDEVADIWFDSHDITISRSIISEGLNKSTNKGEKEFGGRGFIIGSAGSHSISFHHNFMAHNYQRNPLVKSQGVTDVVNNLVYHWVSRSAGVEAEYGDTRVNFVKNKFISVRSTDSRQNSDKRWSDINVADHGNKLEIYLEENYGDRRKYFFQKQSQLLRLGRKKYSSRHGYVVESRHQAPKITEIPVKNLEELLVRDVGATLPRQDSTDTRLFTELRERSGKMPDCVDANDPPSAEVCVNNVGGWPQYSSGTPRIDSDGDGIPDSWEIENGLNPNDSQDSTEIKQSGYMNIELWLHSLNSP